MSTIVTRLGKGSSLTWSEGDANFTNLNTDKWEASIVHAATEKTTPVNADEVPLIDSAASNVLKRLTWSNIKATLKTYFDTLYEPLNSYLIKSNTTANLTVGYTATEYNAGTKSSGTFTPNPALGNLQYAVNGGAHTLAPPSSSCTMIIKYTNNGSAGTITTTGFTVVSGSAPTTTNALTYLAYISKISGSSHLSWQLLV